MFRNTQFSFLYSQAQETRFAQGLTLQLILSELIQSHQLLLIGEGHYLHSTSPLLFPYDWSCQVEHLTKFYEYTHTLSSIFPQCNKSVSQLNKVTLKLIELHRKKQLIKVLKQLPSLMTALEPFILLCNQDENLFLFLLKHQQQIDLLMKPSYLHDLLVKIHPEGLEVVGEKLCDQYHRRGFFSPISECKLLLTQLLHARPTTSTHL